MRTENYSVDEAEIEHFAKDSKHWWDEDGPFRPLHLMNPVRLGYIRDQICQHFDLDTEARQPFTKLKMLDVGCGGGLVCEPLARLGATTNGVDADRQAIDVARNHAEEAKLNITYHNGAAEELVKDYKDKFDVVLALEIIEHVNNIDDFVKTIGTLCKPGGLVIFSTLNRTPKSFALGIVAAEHILRWVPPGTHKWKKFVRPSELVRLLHEENIKTHNISGLVYSPMEKIFKFSNSDMDVNYFLTSIKNTQEIK